MEELEIKENEKGKKKGKEKEKEKINKQGIPKLEGGEHNDWRGGVCRRRRPQTHYEPNGDVIFDATYIKKVKEEQKKLVTCFEILKNSSSNSWANDLLGGGTYKAGRFTVIGGNPPKRVVNTGFVGKSIPIHSHIFSKDIDF